MQKGWGNPCLRAIIPCSVACRTLVFQVTRRRVHDISITRTGKPIIRVQGGRWVDCRPCLEFYSARNAKDVNIDHLLEVKLAGLGLNILAEPVVGHTATVFGATGFLGRYVVSRLGGKYSRESRENSNCWSHEAQKGCTVVVPFRDAMAKRHLKLTGDLGRVIFMVRAPMLGCHVFLLWNGLL